MSGIIDRARVSNQCKYLNAEQDAYDIWYLYCDYGETADEKKCQKGLRNCDLFEGIRL
jgi:hypothetical protein